MTTLAPDTTLDTDEIQAVIATLNNDQRDYLQAILNRVYPYASVGQPYTDPTAREVAKIKADTMATADGIPEAQRRIEFATALIAVFLQQ